MFNKTKNIIIFMLLMGLCSTVHAASKGAGASDGQRADSPDSRSQIEKKDDVIRNFAVVGFPTIAQGTDNDWLGVGLGEDLATRLGQVEGVFSVERLQLNLALASSKINMLKEGVSAEAKPGKKEQERLINLSKVIKGGNMMGADYVIVGSLWMSGKFGDKNTVIKANVRLVKTDTSEVLEAVSVQGSGDQKGYMRLQEDLAEALSEKMGIPEDKRVKVTELKHRAVTGDAYEAFVKARKLLYEGKYAEAIESCHKSERLGVSAILEQLRNTENQAREQLLTAEKDPGKAKALADEYVTLQERRVGEKKEELAIESYYAGESWRQKGDKLEELGDKVNSGTAWETALEHYDNFLKNTKSNLLLWDFEAGGNMYTPTVEHGIAYAYSDDFHLRALDAKTGTMLWDFDMRFPVDNLVIFEGTVYATAGNHLRAFEAIGGKLLWDFEARNSSYSKWYRFGAPTIKNGYVYIASNYRVGIFSDEKNELRAISIRDGSVLWRLDNFNWKRPTTIGAVTVEGYFLHVRSANSDLSIVDAGSGRILTSFEAGDDGMNAPALSDGLVYSVSGSRAAAYDFTSRAVVRAFGVDNVSSPVVLDSGIVYIRSADDRRLTAFDSKTGGRLWSYEGQGSIEAFAFSGRTVFAASKDNLLTALDTLTGEIVRTFRMKDEILSLEAEGDNVYAVTKGELTVLDAKTGNRLWVYSTQTEYPAFAAAGAAVYILSDDKHLMVCDVGSGRELWRFESKKKLHLPKVKDGVAYLVSEDKHLRAFDSITGKLLLDFEAFDEVYSPAAEDGVVYAGSNDKYLRAFNLFNGGNVNSEMTHNAILRKANIYTRLGDNGKALRLTAKELYATEGRSSQTYKTWVAALSTLPQDLQLRALQHVRAKYTGDPKGWPLNKSLLFDSDAGGPTSSFAVSDRVAVTRSKGGHLKAFDLKTGGCLWDYKSRGEIVSMTVANGIVYAGSEDKRLRAFDAITGKLLWEFEAGGSYRENEPIVVNLGAVYAGSADGYLRAFDAGTGQVLWDFKTTDNKTILPAVSDGAVYLSQPGHLRALDAVTGKIIWDKDFDFYGRVEIVDGVVYAGSFDGVLAAFEAKTGNILWYFEMQSWVLPPVVVEGIAYGGTQPTRGNPSFWAFDAKTGKVLWDFRAEDRVWSPIIADGVIYINEKKHLRALNARTGKALWTFESDDEMSAFPVVADGRIYTVSNKQYALQLQRTNHLRAFDAKSGTLLWDFETKDEIDKPVVTGSMVFAFTGKGHLPAFDAGTGKLLWDYETGSVVIQTKADGGRMLVGFEDGRFRGFALDEIVSGSYAPSLTWGSNAQMYSYFIWGKTGLAVRKIIEGYSLKSSLEQAGISRQELEAGIYKLVRGKVYYGLGAAAEDPLNLCPTWLAATMAHKGDGAAEVAARFYLYVASIRETDSASYLVEALGLAPDIDMNLYGFRTSQAIEIIKKVESPELRRKIMGIAERAANNNYERLEVAYSYLNDLSAPDEALRLAKIIQEADPGYPDSYMLSGLLYQRKGDLRRAAESYRTVTEMSPVYAVGWIKYSAVLSEQGDNLAAFKAMRRFIEQKRERLSDDSPTADIFLSAAWYAYLAGEDTAALKYAHEALDMNPAYPSAEAYWVAGLAAYHSGAKSQAGEFFDKAARADPNAWMNYAAFTSDKGRNKEAYESLQLLIKGLMEKGEPLPEGIYLNAGWYAYLAGDKKAAFENTLEALKINQAEPNALYNMALLFVEEEDLDVAVRVYARAVQADSPKVLFDAIGDLRNSIKKIPGSISAWFALGSLLEERLKNAADKESEIIKKQAIGAYEEYLNKSTNSGWMEKARKRIEELTAGK